jgi:hypothetical protein
MKKIPLLIVFLLFAASIWSQSVAILDVNENDISGTTINIPIAAGTYEAAYSIKIKNLTNRSISLKIAKFYEEGPVDGSDNTMCSPSTAAGGGACYLSNITNSFTLAANEISGAAEMHYEPGVNSGTTTIRYTVQKDADATDNTFVILSFSTISAVLPTETKVFSVFPNPASDVVNIEMKEGNNAGIFEIFDISGKIVKNFQLSPIHSQLKIDVSQFESGIYFCRFFGNDSVEKIVKLLIKQH